VKAFPPARATSAARLLLVDRPNSPQSYIVAGQPLATRGVDDPLPLTVANEMLGSAFTSRLNTDLRETRGWAYGVGSAVPETKQQMAFRLAAPVQSDKTGPSIEALRSDIVGYTGARPITPDELTRIVNLTVLSLPGGFETGGALLGALQSNAVLGRPDDYYVKLPARYRALTPGEVADAARAIDPSRFQWIVVGDAKTVRPQLEGLGLPIEVRPAG
jgi:zinc protease